jgi:hypothetical protein
LTTKRRADTLRGVFVSQRVMTPVKLYLADWRRCWRMKAMRLFALGSAIQGAVVTCPAAISDHLPPWVMSWASSIAFICMVFAGLGIGVATRPEKPDGH